MNWIPSGLAEFPIEVTAKSFAWQEHPELPADAGRELGKLILQIYEKGKRPEHDLRRALQRWPDQAAFHLLAAEMETDLSRRKQILEDMARDFPDTIYGRIAMGLHYLGDYTIIEAPEALLAAMPPVQELHPGRRIFPAIEVYLYEVVATAVHASTVPDQEIRARVKRACAMVQGTLPTTLFAEAIQLVKRLRKFIAPQQSSEPDPWFAYYLRSYELDKVDALKAVQTRHPSPLTLGVAAELWRRQFTYDPAYLDRLLAADRAALVQDLTTILLDAIRLYAYNHRNGAWLDAPIHALLLLCHLRAVEAAPAIVDFLGSSDLVVNLYLGDHLTEDLRTWIALLLREDIGLMDTLILRQDVDEYARVLPLSAMEVLCVDHRDMRPLIDGHALHLLQQINRDEVAASDPNLGGMNAHLTNLALEGRLPQLLEALKPLHEADIVDTGINGPWERVVNSFHAPEDPNGFHVPQSIKDMYDDLLPYLS